MDCSCRWAEGGNAETGPRVFIDEIDEECATHGREADPGAWQEMEAIERSHTCSAIQSCIWMRMRTRDENGHLTYGSGTEHAHDEMLRIWAVAGEELALAIYARALARYSEGEDDGWDSSRAAGDVADALIVLALEPLRSGRRRCEACGNWGVDTSTEPF